MLDHLPTWSVDDMEHCRSSHHMSFIARPNFFAGGCAVVLVSSLLVTNEMWQIKSLLLDRGLGKNLLPKLSSVILSIKNEE